MLYWTQGGLTGISLTCQTLPKILDGMPLFGMIIYTLVRYDIFQESEPLRPAASCSKP